jgi:hypothetical protein
MLAVAVSGCGGSDEVETTSDPGEIRFELDAPEGGAQGVRATLTYESDDRTRVVIDGLDEGEPAGGGANPVRLVSGTCDERGNVLASLEPLSGSESSGEVDFGLPELMSGDFAIEVALPGSSAGEVAACGDVPDEAPGS